VATPRKDRPPIKGRGALSQPPGRFESESVEAVPDGWSEPEDLLESRVTSCEPERARSIITTNDSPDIPFDQSINPYRGCEHGCVYCLAPDTQILMGDGSTRNLCDVRPGDEIYGTARRGHYRRYVRTRVLAHWRTAKPGFRVLLGDGTRLEASGDHRFLTECGWKFVAPRPRSETRPILTPRNSLLGFGKLETVTTHAIPSEYARGYLCGMIRGDGHLGVYRYPRVGCAHGDQSRLRLASTDPEALTRTGRFLAGFGVSTDRFTFAPEPGTHRRGEAIRARSRRSVESIYRLTVWPQSNVGELARGFLAGAFDAEGSCSGGILRICNSDMRFIGALLEGLRYFAFDACVETRKLPDRKPVHSVRIRGGLRAHLRFFRLVQPAIRRKFSIDSQSLESTADLAVAEVVPLGKRREFFDITTGTGDFIANGVVSHNCYARPSHSYVGLSPGLDFETRLFYKADAARLLENELARPRYVCKPITLGSNTDPYQPVERRLEVTRSLLQVFVRHRHPVSLITKGALIERDLDLLADLARDRLASVMLSLPTLDESLKRTLEPRAASPRARLRVMRALRDAGIPVGVLVAPVIPAVTDHEIEGILEACQAAGARRAGYVLLRLPYEVKDLFREWLAAHLPDRAAHVMSLIHQQRGERDNDPGFGTRMRGTGPLAALLERRFALACRRLGLETGRSLALDTSRFRAPRADSPQADLPF
jgi:DNA repair photolyase